MAKLNKLDKIGEYFLGIGTHRKYQRKRALYGEFTRNPYELKLKKRASYVTEALDIGIRKLGITLGDLSCMAYAVTYKNPYLLLGIPILEFCRGLASLVDRVIDKKLGKQEKEISILREKIIESLDEIREISDELKREKGEDEDQYGLYGDWTNRDQD